LDFVWLITVLWRFPNLIKVINKWSNSHIILALHFYGSAPDTAISVDIPLQVMRVFSRTVWNYLDSPLKSFFIFLMRLRCCIAHYDQFLWGEKVVWYVIQAALQDHVLPLLLLHPQTTVSLYIPHANVFGVGSWVNSSQTWICGLYWAARLPMTLWISLT
jgi:hypothetical protein